MGIQKFSSIPNGNSGVLISEILCLKNWKFRNDQKTLHPLWKTYTLSSQHSDHAPSLLRRRIRATV